MSTHCVLGKSSCCVILLTEGPSGGANLCRIHIKMFFTPFNRSALHVKVPSEAPATPLHQLQ